MPGNENPGNELPGVKYPERYVVKPAWVSSGDKNTIAYKSDEAAARSAAEGETKYLRVVYKDYDYRDDSYNYLIYLGRIESVPMNATWAGVEYNGRSPITISRKDTKITTNSIEESFKTAVTVSHTKVKDKEFKVGAGVSYGPFSASASARIQETVTDSTVKTKEDTITKVQSETVGEEDSVSVTIGNNNEEVGLYRWTLFADTDVYLTLKFDQNNKLIGSPEISVCARPNSFVYKVDYKKESTGDWPRTGGGGMLPIPDDYSSLTIPATVSRFIAVSGSRKAVSDGGIDWTTETFNNQGIIKTFENNFVVLTNDLKVLTSVNGVKWDEKITAPGNATYKSIASDENSKWVVVGKNSSEETYRPIMANNNNKINYNGGVISYLAKASGVETKSTVRPSFRPNSSLGDPLYPAWNDVIYANGKWVAVGGLGIEKQNGSEDYDFYSSIAHSSDGAGWSLITPVKSTTEMIAWNGVTYGNNLYVAVGENGYGYSTNGTTWTKTASNCIWIKVKYHNGMFVAVGRYGLNGGRIAYSSDGKNWTVLSVNSGTGLLSGWNDITYGDGKWVAVGGASQLIVVEPRIAYSTDGKNWTTKSLGTSAGGILTGVSFVKYNVE